MAGAAAHAAKNAVLAHERHVGRRHADRRSAARDVSSVTDAPRPVPLSYEYALTPLEGTVELALRKDEGPLYVVHFSQDAALTSAQNLASYGVATKEQREAVKEAMKGAQFSTAFGKTLKRLLGCGVGVHHAGMLPRYRLLVEKLAHQGLLPIICGTDTLGVGINLPIHTVVLTQLTKFDGRKMRRLRSREFHQIAGRAGRSGFDTEGVVIAEAPEHEIENHKAEVKAAGDPKKLKKIKKKRPPENFVNWNEDTFNKLIDSVPEQLTPRMRITHSMVLAEVEQGGNARARVDQLIEDSLQPAEEKVKLHVRAAEVLQTLIDADVVVHEVDEGGEDVYSVTMDLPEDFALDAARTRAQGARCRHGGDEDGRRGLRRAFGAHRRRHVPQAAGGPAGCGVLEVLRCGAVGARLLPAAEIGAARHAGKRGGLQGVHPEARHHALRGYLAALPVRGVPRP